MTMRELRIVTAAMIAGIVPTMGVLAAPIDQFPHSILVTATSAVTGLSRNVSGYDSLTSAPLGLTSEEVSSSMSALGQSASSFASANLATGLLKAAATSSSAGNSIPQGQGIASAHAQFTEGLTFSAAGLVTFSFHIDGLGASSPPGIQEEIFVMDIIGGTGSTSQFMHIFRTDFLGNSQLDNSAPLPWFSQNIVSHGDHDADFSGTIELLEPNSTIGLMMYLTVATQGDAFADFTHTASVTLGLPDGMTFTSGSGVFLTEVPTTAVPEAGSIAMLTAGLCALGWIRRRRPSCGRG
jgi:hypothetical protein